VTTTSMRRLCWRPSSVLLVEVGRYSPKPDADSASGLSPLSCRRTTVVARAVESSQLVGYFARIRAELNVVGVPFDGDLTSGHLVLQPGCQLLVGQRQRVEPGDALRRVLGAAVGLGAQVSRTSTSGPAQSKAPSKTSSGSGVTTAACDG